MISRIPENDCPEKALPFSRKLMDFYEEADLRYEEQQQREADDERRDSQAKSENKEGE